MTKKRRSSTEDVRKKEFRGREYNIAQTLLETLISYCKDNEINDIYLGTVSVLKAAQRFYERNYFEKP